MVVIMDLNLEEKNIRLIELIKNCKSKKVSPIIIEFDGTPNSGKTTIAEETFKVLNNLFKCSYITERAINCKINDKLSPQFNFVTGTQTVIKIIEEIECGNQIIVCERGLLDAIFWMDFHYANNKISNKSNQLMTDFYLSEEFINYKVFSIVMQCNSSATINREKIVNKYITNKRIVNKHVIDMYNVSIEECYAKYKHFFKAVKIDTSSLSIQDTFDSCLFYILKYISEELKNEV